MTDTKNNQQNITESIIAPAFPLLKLHSIQLMGGTRTPQVQSIRF